MLASTRSSVPVVTLAVLLLSCGRTGLSRNEDPRADAQPWDGGPADTSDTTDLDVRDVPDVPDVPDIPDVPDVPDTPDLPDVPPDVPDTPDVPDVPPDVPGCIDRDGDGYGVGTECLGPDCNDGNRFVNPAAAEVCNDIDDDCDLENDEGCPPDLIVDAETIQLDGSHLYDRVDILNGGRIEIPVAVEPDRVCGPESPGCLAIRARLILVRTDSGIDAGGAGQCVLGMGDAAGYPPPELMNVGPGGGAYGGAGGAGPDLSGGEPYGTADGRDIQSGSPGRGFSILAEGVGGVCDDLVGLESHGGAAGGCIALSAPDIAIDGYLRSNGIAGERARDSVFPAIVDGAAGGAGGGILVDGDRVRLGATATLVAVGGAGGAGGTYNPGGRDQCYGNGGGGGGGGRIKVFGGVVDNLGAAFNVRGGPGATGPQNDAEGGQPGSVVVR